MLPFWGECLLPVPRIHTNRLSGLTCVGMAALVAAGPAGAVGGPTLGSFVLVSRPPEWDEVLLSGFVAGSTEFLGRTTSEDGSDWVWVLVRLDAGNLRSPTVNANGTRSAPRGLGANNVNWICVPPEAADQWIPGQGDIHVVVQDAALVLTQLQQQDLGNYVVNVPGQPGGMTPLQLRQVVPAPVVPAVVGPDGGPGAPVLGLGGNAAAGREQDVDLKALEAAVQQLQAMSLQDRDPKKARHSNDRKKKKKGKKDKKKDAKKSKKKKRGKKSRGFKLEPEQQHIQFEQQVVS